MKYLSTYKTFESSYNREEYYDFLSRELSKYNITPVQVRDLLTKLGPEIDNRLSSGESPLILAGQLKKEMDLSVDRGSLGVRFNQPSRDEIKYL